MEPKMINVFQPSLGDDELAAVNEVFKTSWIGRGTRVAEFEAAWAAHLGVGRPHVTSTNSCTEATFLAMELLGVGPGDEVVVPTVNFVGAANAVAAHGARPVFCDVDPEILNPAVEDIERCLTASTRGVLLLHYGGRPGHIVEIAELCRDRGIWLMEDAANAQASTVDGKACGTFGDIAAWSFDWGKIAVALDGGMLYAKDPEVAAEAARRAYLGMAQSSGFSEAHRAQTRWWEFEVSSFSRRSIMNDVQAAVGTTQLAKIGDFVKRRRVIAEFYDSAFAEVPGLRTPPPLPAGHESSYYIYWVQMDPEIRDAVARQLFDEGIYTTFRYQLLHKVEAYDSDARLPGAERAAASTLCLPIHQALSDSDIGRVVDTLARAVRERAHG
jgi:dTDP-4-amino-4,6-dideoxygalactose transaminase